MPGPHGSVTEAREWQVSLRPFNIYLSSGELELDAFVLSAAAATCNRGHLWKEFSKQRLQSGDSGRVYMPGAKCDEGMIDMLQGCSGFTSSSGAIEH